MLCRRTPFCLRYLFSLYHPRNVPGSHEIECYVYFYYLTFRIFSTSKGIQKGVVRKRNYEHYTPCVLPNARATASYTPRNSFIRESSGSVAASPRVCSGGGGDGLSGTFSNPKSPVALSRCSPPPRGWPSVRPMRGEPSNCGEGKYDGRTSDVTDVTTVIAGEFRAEGGAAGTGGRGTFL